MDKLVGEGKYRGCDKQLTSTEPWTSFQFSVLRAGATTSLHKVKNFRGEQNNLERLAIDCDSQVRQVSETLLLLAVRLVLQRVE